MEISREMLEEIISYIEESEQDKEWEYGSCRKISALTEGGEMPELYYRLKELLKS